MSTSTPFRLAPFCLTALLGMILVYVGCTVSQEPSESVQGESVETTYANWVKDAEFVGKEVCGSCHQPQFETFIRSQMGRSWKHAVRSLSDADWNDPAPIYSQRDDLYYQPFARGEDLFVREFRLSGSDTAHVRVEQIDFIVGSGQHTNSHIYEENGYLYQIPVTWYAQDAKWGLAPKFEKLKGNMRFDRVITDECMACHNATPRFVAGSENRFDFVPSGIDCEKCHGPGSVHVEAKKAGKIVNTAEEIDFTIVNPAKLSPERQWDVCRRCHMQGAAVFGEGQSPFDWRPGRVLKAHENVYWDRQPDSTSNFIMAAHPDRLAMSACFEASWAKDSKYEPMTCLTCHNPHLPIEETGPGAFNQACLQCHNGASAAASTESAPACTQPDVASGINTQPCFTCHMPKSLSSDIPNIRITDHFIRVPSRDPVLPEDVEAKKRFLRLASLVDPDPGPVNRANGFMTYYEQVTNRPGMLDSAEVHLNRARRKRSGTPATASWIRLWFLKKDYSAILRYLRSDDFVNPGDAWTYYRVGEAYAAMGDPRSAVEWFKRAVELGPDHLRFRDKLAVAHTNMGQLQEAIGLYDQILEDNPLFGTAWNNRGFARMLNGELDAAENDFRKAISLDPDMELALGNLASLLFNTDRQAQARPLVRRLLTLDSDNPDYRRMWELMSAP